MNLKNWNNTVLSRQNGQRKNEGARKTSLRKRVGWKSCKRGIFYQYSISETLLFAFSYYYYGLCVPGISGLSLRNFGQLKRFSV